MASRSRPNIILVVLDTVRAQNLGIYGYETETMPFLSSFAEDALTFDRAYANAPWTLPSHASLFTGQLPSNHNCHGGTLQFDSELPTMAQQLKQAGYETYGVSNNIWLSDHFGLDRGFDTFYKQWQLFRETQDLGHVLKSDDSGIRYLAREIFRGNPLVNALNGLYGKYLYRRNDFGGRRTTDDVLSLTEGADEPFFLFANYMEAHAPYKRHTEIGVEYPTPADESLDTYEDLSGQSYEYHTGKREISADDFEVLEELYDGELSYLDYCLERLFNGLKQQGHLEDSLVVVVGDHGENIGEHGLMAHRFSVHDTVLNVPLIVSYPEPIKESGRRNQPVDLRAVHDEILAFGTGSADEGPLRTNEETPVVAEYLDPSYTPEAEDDQFPFADSEYDKRYRAVITQEYKYVYSDKGEETVYRYREDGSTQEILPEDVEVIESLRSKCDGFDEDDGSAQFRSNEGIVEQHLSDLGYM